MATSTKSTLAPPPPIWDIAVQSLKNLRILPSN